jgi:hypothetical protein
MTYTLTCSCGGYTATFDRQDVAEAVAEIHTDLGEGHGVTCTRPAHNRPGAVPVIVFASKRSTYPAINNSAIGFPAPVSSECATNINAQSSIQAGGI